MSLTVALNNSLSGLRINQQSLAVLSNNIANVSTPGYSKQTVSQSALYIGGMGTGVSFDGVVRKVDQYLQRTVRDNSSSVNSAGIVTDYSDRIQILLSPPGSGSTLDAYIGNFTDSLQNLTTSPELVSFRSNAVQAGQALANEISSLATGLHDLRFQADADLKQAAAVINQQLRRLEAVNASLISSIALGQSVAPLLDERDAALDQLSEYLNISVFTDANGLVNVYTTGGAPLVDGNVHEVVYTPLNALESFISDASFTPLYVNTLNAQGQEVGLRVNIISGGTSSEVTTELTGGKLKGLHEMRDKFIPEILEQLDMLSSRLRDEMNRVHNMGTGAPPPSLYSGTRLVSASTPNDWAGQVRIAVLDTSGNPAQSQYIDELGTGFRPLTLDLSILNGGDGSGRPTTQAIIDEINNHFGAPPPKAKLANLNDIQIATNTNTLPSGSPPTFNFDFDLENISGETARFFVTDIQVANDVGAPMTNVTSTIPQFDLDPVNTYRTVAGTDTAFIRTTTPSTAQAGDMIYLSDPGGLPALIGGVPSAEFTGFVRVVSVTGTEIEFELVSTAGANATVAQAGAVMNPDYDRIQPGDQRRTTSNGTFSADLSAFPFSNYYDVTATVAVIEEDGTLSTATITYRVPNNEQNIRNQRYSATAVTGDATRVLPNTSQGLVRAILVDEHGVELPQINGSYGDQEGFLKLVTVNENYTIAIDSLDSAHLGDTTATPTDPGTQRGFSHFFELNNFFVSNDPTATGDTLKNSAINLDVEQRLLDKPNYISTARLSLSLQPADPDAAPYYTYVVNRGDNRNIEALGAVTSTQIQFDSAGGLATTTRTISSYTGEFLGFSASRAAIADSDFSNANTLYEGFKGRLDSIRGVNLDEELANTIIYQNAYTASARITTVVDEMFQSLLEIG
jgi:flagellar hook-associated protein FlgK